MRKTDHQEIEMPKATVTKGEMQGMISEVLRESASPFLHIDILRARVAGKIRTGPTDVKWARKTLADHVNKALLGLVESKEAITRSPVKGYPQYALYFRGRQALADLRKRTDDAILKDYRGLHNLRDQADLAFKLFQAKLQYARPVRVAEALVTLNQAIADYDANEKEDSV
jgi:hypothetical protein